MEEENFKLTKQYQSIKQVNLHNIQNKQEIMMMSDEEVKNRIMQIAKGYRYERVKNEKIEKTLRKAQQDISSRAQ